MSFLRNREFKGLMLIAAVVLLAFFVVFATTGKLEQWFGVTWFSGPSAYGKIIYVSNESGDDQLYISNPDGSEKERITSGLPTLSAPVINPAGNRLLYVGLVDQAPQVLKIGAFGGTPENVTNSSGPKSYPMFSPDGRFISYIASGKAYVCDMAGENLHPVLPPEDHGHSAPADVMGQGDSFDFVLYAWGRDSNSMLAANRDGFTKALTLYYMPEVGGEAQKLSRVYSKINGITLNPYSGEFIITWKKNKDAGMDLFSPASGELKTLFAVKSAEIGRADVSPVREDIIVPLISFSSKQPSGLLELKLANGQGGIAAVGVFSSAFYSPDGEKIIATGVDTAKSMRDVVIFDFKTRKLEQVTDNGGGYGGIWTPAKRDK